MSHLESPHAGNLRMPLIHTGGENKVIHKPGLGHHPHGLDDPMPVVQGSRRILTT